MKPLLSRFAMFAVTSLIAAAAVHAAPDLGYKAYSKSGAFDDVMFELQNAIVSRGLVIDYTGHLNTMLERTSEAVGGPARTGDKSPYIEAKYLQFCSAKLSHEAVSANPFNIAICPYVVFIFESRSEPGTIHVGYRRPISDRAEISRQALARVEALLDGIVRDALK